VLTKQIPGSAVFTGMSTSVDDEVDKVPPMTTQMSSSVVISYETQAKERPRARGFSFKDVASREVQRSSSTDLDDADPEYAISLLRRGTANLTPLKLKLASCTDDWMLGFLDQGGLELVFVCLERLGERGFAKLAVAIDQLTCVGCIRAVMNSKVGLDHIVDNSRYVRTLAEGISTILSQYLFAMVFHCCNQNPSVYVCAYNTDHIPL
jgi:hypothetical protein